MIIFYVVLIVLHDRLIFKNCLLLFVDIGVILLHYLHFSTT